MPVEVNPLLVRINANGGTGLAGPETSVDGNLVEFADIYGTRTRDSGVSVDDLTLDSELPWVNVMDYGAIGDGNSHPLSSVYADLPAAQVVYPAALSLSEEIDGCALQKAINTGAANIYCPRGSGYFRWNQNIVIPYASSGRQGYVRIFGDGSGAGSAYGSVWIRSGSAASIKLTGGSFTLGQGNKLGKYLRLEDIRFAGGWAAFNTSADYPVIDINCGYELIWDDVVITDGIGHLVLFREVMDSRFKDVRITVGGQHYGYSKALTMTSGSTAATVTSNVGLFVGQKIFGTGLASVYVSAINANGTGITLSSNANYTGTRTVAFEAKAAMHICSNDTGSATSNNLVLDGFRFESGPATALRISGNNIIDIWANNFKAEHVFYAMDYLIDVETASVVNFDKAWVYAAPTYLNYMEFAVTTSGKTLASVLAANLDSFTISNMYAVQTGTVTDGSAIITGLSDTSVLRVGQNVSGTGISTGTSYLGIYIVSIDSGTQVTLSQTAQTGAGGSKSLTFSYLFNSGNFNLRQFFGGMCFVNYDTEDTRNYSLNRVVNYDPATGVVDFHVLAVFGDTSKSITSWKVAACHPGLVRMGATAKQMRGVFSGGYQAGTPVTSRPYLHTFVHIDGVNGADISVDPNGGTAFCLPKNSWQAQVSTSSNTIGTGTKTFTIATGLNASMFADNKTVFISQNSVAGSENYMIGTVNTSGYNSGTGALSVNVTRTNGSGTINNWKIAFEAQPMYLKTGTNSNLNLKEFNTTYGNPASTQAAIHPILSDVKFNSGSRHVNSVVYYDTYAAFATITPDANTLYLILDQGGGYFGSTRIFSFAPSVAEGFTGQKYFAQATLTDGASIAWDLNTQQAAKVTLGGNRTLANPTNMKAGASYTLIVVQDGTGSRTLAYGANYKWPSGSAPVLSTAANAIDILTFVSDGTNMLGSALKAFA